MDFVPAMQSQAHEEQIVQPCEDTSQKDAQTGSDGTLSEAELEACCKDVSKWVCPCCQRELSRKQTLKTHLHSMHSVRAGTATKRYKMYEYSSSAKIPRSTKSRWNIAEKNTENEELEYVARVTLQHENSFKLDESQDMSLHQEDHCSPQTQEIYLEFHGECQENFSFSENENAQNFHVGQELIDGSDNYDVEDMNCSSSSETDSDSQSEPDSDTSSGDEMTSQDTSPPLYVFPPSETLQTSPISHKQHMLLLSAYATSQNLSGVAFQQLLEVVRLHLPDKNICEENVLELKEKLANEEVKYYDICRKCSGLYKDEEMICRTPGCGTRKITDKSDRKRVCFATGGCEKQLSSILERPGNMEKVEEEVGKRLLGGNTVICDITSGQMYKELCKTGQFLDPNQETCNITLTWNTDGIPLFKSSAVSLWPIYLAINELPPKERFLKKNMVVWGIWQGDVKPSMNTFLSPFVKDIMRLYHAGFSVHGKPCRAMLLLGSMDLQARAYVMNSVQHNGASSCLYCEDTGKVVKSGKGHCRCYPQSEEVTLRTKLSITEAGAEAVSCGKAVRGFYGKSVLLCLPFFQPHQHIVIDYMHGVLLGINKKLFSFWFEGKFCKEDFFIGNKIDEIDAALKKIKPPYLIRRLPRKLKNNCHRWKASEIRSWFLFYSIPCLHTILPSVYLEHYACLVEGIHLLLMECISLANLHRAKLLLNAFYKNSSDLYGENFSGLNMHNLAHYADFVQMWGPLWAWSCFGFESCNGEMLRSVHGKGNVCSEIFWSIHAEKQIDLQTRNMPKGEMKSFLHRILPGRKRNCPKTEPAYQCEYIPPLRDIVLEEELVQALKVLGNDDDDVETSFSKIVKLVRHGFVFYSKACTRVRKRNSFTVLLECPAIDGGNGIIIEYFILHKGTRRVFAVGQTLAVLGPVLHKRTSHVQKVEKISRNFVAVPVQNLKEPVVYIEINGVNFIARFPNFVEMD